MTTMVTAARTRRTPILALVAAGPLLAACGCERKPGPPMPVAPDGWLEFEGTWNAVGSRRRIHLGDNGTSSTLHLQGAVQLSGAGRPGVGFRAELVAFADSAGELLGRCVWTDEKGDQVFSELKRSAAGRDTRITGTFLGGTGRFTGATGGYDFAWQYLIDADDDAVQGRTVGLKGRFRQGASPRQGESR